VEHVDAFAAELIGALGTAQAIEPFTARDPSFGTVQAYAVAARVHAERVARGERPVGRKIGFTNRAMWDEYGVREPIWGYVYDTTLFRPRGGRAATALAGFAEPRIEPEVVLHFKAAPPPTRDEAAILDCIDWIAHGFEIVQSPFPDWKFKVADTIAVNGLHGELFVGEPVPVASIPDCAQRLREFRIALKKGDAVAAEGIGANALDSPLLALAHLVEVLARLPQFPPLAAGELVTTGTLTSALRVAPGETWSTTLSGIALPGLSIAFK
jgi:2-oxo-3-hexenedioate decarboxylase